MSLISTGYGGCYYQVGNSYDAYQNNVPYGRNYSHKRPPTQMKTVNQSECSNENYLAPQIRSMHQKTHHSSRSNKVYVMKKPLSEINIQPNVTAIPENRKCAPVYQKVNKIYVQTKKEHVVVPHNKSDQIKPVQKKMSCHDVSLKLHKHLSQPEKSLVYEGDFVNRCFSLASF